MTAGLRGAAGGDDQPPIVVTASWAHVRAHPMARFKWGHFMVTQVYFDKSAKHKDDIYASINEATQCPLWMEIKRRSLSGKPGLQLRLTGCSRGRHGALVGLRRPSLACPTGLRLVQASSPLNPAIPLCPAG